jgi:hypothetical protein
MKKRFTNQLFMLLAGLLASVPALAQEEAKIQNIRVLLNNGNKYAQTPSVTLKIEALGARHMMVNTTGDFAGAAWKEYQPNAGQISFSDEEGEKVVYVKLKDKYGNETKVLTSTILYDRTPPASGTVEINAEGGVVNNPERHVTLELAAVNVKYMLISNNSAFREARWQVYKPSLPNWKLEAGPEGLKKVFVKFRDGAGNESEVASDEILVDSEPPVDPRISINGNQKVTTDLQGKVKLALFVRGGLDYKLSESPRFDGADWQPYQTAQDWTLSPEQGEKTLYVKYRDQAQNESEVAMAKILLDNQPPQNCKVVVDRGAKYAEDPDRFVELRLEAVGATFMMVSNSLDFANARWEAFREVVPKWRLVGENGEKTIYVRFKDQHGNETGIYKAVIILAI